MSGLAVFGLLPLAAAVAAVISEPFGLVALRVRRHTFIVVTIAVFFIFQLMAYNFPFTGGSTGLSAPFLNWRAATYNNPFYYIALAVAAGTTALAWLIRRSRFGLQLRAIRDDEDRARGLGVRPMRVKLAAFTVSAIITGLAGGLWFYFITQVQPPSGFDPLFDLSIAVMAFLGGLGTVAGPVLGALLIEPGQLYLTQRFTNGYLSEILLGVLFLLVILLLPRGIIPAGSEKITAWRARRDRRARPGGTRAQAPPRGRRAPRRRQPPRDPLNAGSRRPPAAARAPPGGGHHDGAAAGGRHRQGVRRRPGAERLHARSQPGQRGGAHRAERVGQDHLVQRDHRVRAGRRRGGHPRRRGDHQRAP